MKKSVFELDEHALVYKYFELIDRDLRENIHDEVLKYRFNQILPKIMIRAVLKKEELECVHLIGKNVASFLFPILYHAENNRCVV